MVLIILSTRVEIYFPNDAILNFSNSILEAEIAFNHRGNGGGTAVENYFRSVYPPRYGLASLIQELNIYLNGQTISKLHNMDIFTTGLRIGYKFLMLK
jgi:hypothetical protein